MSSAEQFYEMDSGLIADALKIRFFPHVTHSGEGARLKDAEDREYVDFSAGWAVANTGYSHPLVKAAREGGSNACRRGFDPPFKAFRSVHAMSRFA